MSLHVLKTWPEYFAALLDGSKTFEVRRYDRPFEVGDTLALEEYDPARSIWTGRTLTRRVTYVMTGGKFGVEDGFVVMGLTSPDLSRPHPAESDQ